MVDFAPAQAALRFRRVQQLARHYGLDGVLLVPGVDGKYGPSTHAIGYLLEGRSNRDTLDVNKLGDQLEDVVVLVTPGDVQIYVPSPELQEQLRQLLLPSPLPSLRLFGPTPAEASDPDALEENKLASFVHMLRGCKRLGIPCGLAATATAAGAGAAGATANGGPPQGSLPRLGAGELVALERWPLLQAYGLEGVGRSGFFTMNFEVYDVQAALSALAYGELDGRAAAVLAGGGGEGGAGVLRQHWDEMLLALGGKAAGGRGALSEKQVAEPLVGYFAYGLLRPVPGVEQAREGRGTVVLPPRVVFGPRSSDDAAAPEAAPLSSCGPGPGGPGGLLPPLHGVVEAADPRSGLRAARTLFLCRGAAGRDVFADLDAEAEEGYSFSGLLAAGGWGPAAAEAVGLMRLYAALVEAARAAMAHFATADNATGLTAKAVAQEELARRAEQLGVAGGAGGVSGAALAARLRFSLLQFDHANRVTAPAVRGSRQLKVLRLSLPDVSARATSGPYAGLRLGGLVYGDTFIDLPPAAAAAAATASSAGAAATAAAPAAQQQLLLVLTDSIPALAAVPAGGPEEQLAGRALRSLGAVVGGGGAAARAAGGAAPQLQQQQQSQLARDQSRRAGAVAAADSQALAARVRARNREAAAADGVTLPDSEEDEEAEEEEDAAAAAANNAAGGAAAGAGGGGSPIRPPPEEALGRLLTLGGGDDAVLLTGAPACPAVSGTLYCFSAGLVFVEAVSRAVWTLDIRGSGGGGGGEGAAAEAVAAAAAAVANGSSISGAGGGGLQAITMQQLPVAAALGLGGGGAEAGGGGGLMSGGSLGEAVVFRGGAGPGAGACGLAPACHLTVNTHLALALAAMSPAARRFIITTVLPAWQQTLREAAAAAEEEGGGGGGAASYLKDMDAPNPFPAALHREHAFAIRSSTAGGLPKAWPALVAPDAAVEAALAALDAAEVRQHLSGTHPHVEALLLQPPPPATAAAGGGATAGEPPIGLALVVGLPGGDQAPVAAALTAMLSGAAEGSSSSSSSSAARVALLPAAAGPLTAADFAAALSAAVQHRRSGGHSHHHHAHHPHSGGGGSGGTGAQPPLQHLVIATASHVGLPEQLAMLAAAMLGGSSSNCLAGAAAAAAGGLGAWHLHTVAVCVAGETLEEEPARSALAAGALAQLAPGYVDVVVVGGVDAARAAAAAALVADRLPVVATVRSGRPQLLLGREVLLPPAAERLARRGAPGAVAGRRWAPLVANVGGGGGGSGGGGLLGPLQAVRVAFDGPLDVAKLKQELRGLGIPQDAATAPALPLADTAADGSAAESGLVAVTGCVRLPPPPAPANGTTPPAAAAAAAGGGATTVWELLGSRGAVLRSREWALGGGGAGGGVVLVGGPKLPAGAAMEAPAQAGGELTFIGTGAAVEEGALRRLLGRCAGGGGAAAAAAAAPAAAAATGAAATSSGGGGVPGCAAEVTAEQRAAIRAARAWEPLPPGYCYNGTQYFDAFGDASLDHPDMDRFVEEWVAEQQAKAAEATAAACERAAAIAVVRVEGPVRL
ncbi:hypothetical protein HYH02_006557 [Chlamydomonas schloesseri]|uniref:DAAF9 N-terminal domain-containing protein n=1 Tax=Chlamydomonas schloesseri TaxID=2026947 RepID=A0A835T554_9CHLO|nr:hypothetical protein HYH02_006557 [Chlamydomonas schloesseri]|eukprot:KAG2439029.1 hypothetical protein HYH02_006557 [Chlamydomonas schloesseri]